MGCRLEVNLGQEDLLGGWKCEATVAVTRMGKRISKIFAVEVEELGFHLGIIVLWRVLTPPLINSLNITEL